MEYVYAALLLHKLKQEITEDNVKNVIKATGATPDDVRIKALVAALSEVNIEETLKATPPTASSVAPPITGGGSAATGAPKEEEKKEKKEEEALEGLSALFG
jgi:large subunit ribosomal protein L12